MNAQLAKVFGLRAGHPLDEKLAAALANPGSKCSVRFVYGRGLSALYVGGMYVVSVGAECDARRVLMECAERLPEFPHLKEWAEKL